MEGIIFLPKRYFSFNQVSYKLIANDFLGVLKVTFDHLKEANIGSPIDLRTWRAIKSWLMLNHDNVIYLKSYPHLRIPYVYWGGRKEREEEALPDWEAKKLG
mgnify:CR=1 FL=1